MKLNRTAAVVIGAAVLVSGSIGAASADDIAKMITSKDIKDGTIQVKDLTDGAANKLAGADGKDGAAGADGAKGATGAAGAAGAAGAKGDTGAAGAKGDTGPAGAKGDTGAPGAPGESGVLGAYYAQAFYNAGNTNMGAIATVGCSNVTDVAISGGVQVLGLDAGANARNTPVSSSFPGRMDWSTQAPKADRLDGWIVQFGGTAGSVSPEKTKIWALCVPGADIPVVQTYIEDDGS